MRYRLLAGVHIDENKRRYEVGDVVESTRNLERDFGSEKFRELRSRSKRDLAEDSDFDDSEVPEMAPGTPKEEKAAHVRRSAGPVKPPVEEVEEEEIPPVRAKAPPAKPMPMPVAPQTKPYSSSEDEGDEDEEDTKVDASGHPTNLDSMTLPQLKKYAEEEEIDLGSATTKKDILAAIRGDHT